MRVLDGPQRPPVDCSRLQSIAIDAQRLRALRLEALELRDRPEDGLVAVLADVREDLRRSGLRLLRKRRTRVKRRQNRTLTRYYFDHNC